MVGSFLLLLEDDSGLLEQVGLDVSSRQFSRRAKVNSDELSESRGVIVTDGFGVTERFQDGVGLDDLIFEVALLAFLRFFVLLLEVRSDDGEVGDDLFRVLSLSGARLTAEYADNGLQRISVPRLKLRPAAYFHSTLFSGCNVVLERNILIRRWLQNEISEQGEKIMVLSLRLEITAARVVCKEFPMHFSLGPVVILT